MTEPVSTQAGQDPPNPVEDQAPPATLAQLKAAWAPVRGTVAAIDPHLWDQYLWAVTEVSDRQAQLDMIEAEIREAARGAQYLTVGGRPVATRIVQEVRNASWVKDFYRRTPARKETT